MRFRTRVLVAALLGASIQALAVPVTFGSSAKLGNVTYALRDLDPNDGIAASASLVDRTATTGAVVYGSRGEWRVARTNLGTQPGALTTSLSRNAAFAASNTFLANNAMWMSSDGDASTYAGRFDAYGGAARFTLAFDLAPHTAMDWGGLYYTHAWSGAATGSDARSSWAAVQFGNAAHTYTTTAFSDAALGDPVAHGAGMLDFVLQNDTDRTKRVTATFATLMGGGDISLATIGRVAPVPEPSTYVLMAAGLWMMGLIVRRRTR